MENTILGITPVMPSSDIARDTDWYARYTGFTKLNGDDMYAVLRRTDHYIHLQWHAGTEEDPLLGGSVIKLFVEDIHPWFDEFCSRGTIHAQKLRMNTAWGTHEFGFYDLNQNAIFIVQDI